MYHLHLSFCLCGREGSRQPACLSARVCHHVCDRWAQLWGFRVCLAAPTPKTSGPRVKFSPPTTVWSDSCIMEPARCTYSMWTTQGIREPKVVFCADLKVSVNWKCCGLTECTCESPSADGYVLIFFMLSLRNGRSDITSSENSNEDWPVYFWLKSHKDCSSWDAFFHGSYTFFEKVFREDSIVAL